MSSLLLLKLIKLQGKTGLNITKVDKYPPGVRIKNICRICANYSDSNLVSIFGDQSAGGGGLAGDIMKCANVSILADDALPKNMCRSCRVLLDSAVLFKSTCEESDRKLKEIVVSLSSENIDESAVYECDDTDAVGYMLADVEDMSSEKPALRQPVSAVASEKSSLHCVKCDLRFRTGAEMRKHILDKEHVSRPWKCAHCNKEFQRKSQYTSHIQVHSERKYLCEICGKKCLQRHELKRHVMSHQRVTPFHCKFCEYKTWDSCYLKLHQTIHTGERKYSCPHCPKKFINNSNMKRHIEKHSDPKPYHCDLCDMRYTTKYALRDHKLRSHDKLWLFHCPECCVIKSCRKDLQLHMSKVHKESYVPSHSTTKGPVLDVRTDQAVDDNIAESRDLPHRPLPTLCDTPG